MQQRCGRFSLHDRKHWRVEVCELEKVKVMEAVTLGNENEIQTESGILVFM